MKRGGVAIITLILIWVFFPTAVSYNLQDNLERIPYQIMIKSDIEFGSLNEGEGDIYDFVVLAIATRFLLSLNGPSEADFDLYLRLNLQPTLYNYDYCATSSSSDESLSLSNPTAGIWYVMVYAYSGSGSYSLTLDVDYPETEPDPTTSSPHPTPTSTPTPSTSSSSSSNPSSISNSQSLILNNGSMFLVLGLLAGFFGLVWLAKNRIPRKYTPGGTTINLSSSSHTDKEQIYGSQRPISRSDELLIRGISFYNLGDYVNAAALMIEVLKIDPNNYKAKQVLLLSLQRLQSQ